MATAGRKIQRFIPSWDLPGWAAKGFWRTEDDLPTEIIEEIEAAILGGMCEDYLAENGQYYRWSEAE